MNQLIRGALYCLAVGKLHLHPLMGNKMSSSGKKVPGRGAGAGTGRVVGPQSVKKRAQSSPSETDGGNENDNLQLPRDKRKSQKPGPLSKKRRRLQGNTVVAKEREEDQEREVVRVLDSDDDDGEQDSDKPKDKVMDPNDEIKFKSSLGVVKEGQDVKKARKEREKNRTRARDKLGQTVPTTSGPRARCGNDPHYSVVTDILKKWEGADQDGNLTEFYLVQFEGIKDIDLTRANEEKYLDFWVAASSTKGCFDMMTKFHKREEMKKKETRTKTGADPEKGERSLYYESSDEHVTDEEDKIIPGTSSTGGGSRRLRESQALGFDRNLEPESVIGAVSEGDTIVYWIKFKGSNVADGISSEVARYECPGLIIDYLIPHLTNVPEFEDMDDFVIPEP